MTFLCKDIINHLEKLCPRNLALDWDNVGLLVGDRNQEIKKVLVALDATEEVIDEAINNKVDLIVTHHPFFNPKWGGPIKSITTDHFLGKMFFKLIRNNISIYSAHTNLDIANGGVNDVLANLFELENINILETTSIEKIKKIVVTVPVEQVDTVREAMARAGAGILGNYSDCAYISQGRGTFKPLDGANPFIGQVGVVENVVEYKIETFVREKLEAQVVKAMLEAHPYEEVIYDIYPIENSSKTCGVGRIGELHEEISVENFLQVVKEKLGLKTLRFIGEINRSIKKVGICSGSGMSLLKDVILSGVDLYITGDVKYHEAQEALANGLNIIDAGHYETENIIVPVLKEYLLELKELEVIESKVDANPFKII